MNVVLYIQSLFKSRKSYTCLKGSKSSLSFLAKRIFWFSIICLVLFPPFGVTKGICGLVLNGAYVKLNGGASGTPITLVVNQSDAAGITRLAGGGQIISENEYNIVKWNNIGTSTGTYTFPFGNGTTYIPFVFDKTTTGTVATTGAVSLSTWYTLNNATVPTGVPGVTMCPDESSAIDRFWVIDVAGYSADPTATVDFYYDATELDGIAEANLKAQRWNDALVSACKWEQPVGTVNVASQYVRVSSISSFSPWTLSNELNPLPVQLLYFTAQWSDEEYNKALLKWRTASEINNDYFIIERSLDAINFTPILKVYSYGNSSQPQDYSTFDMEPYKDKTSYYRLKQVDMDGKYKYSRVEALNINKNINLITIYPNPSRNNFEYLVASSEDTKVSVRVVEAGGKEVFTRDENVNRGVTKKGMDVSGLSSGNYILQITLKNSNQENQKTEKQFLVR